MYPRAPRTVLAQNSENILGRTFLKKHSDKEYYFVASDATLFSTINLAYVLEINIFGIDYSNLRHLKKCTGTRSYNI